MARLGDFIEAFWPNALHFVLNCDRAADRCKRRACRKAGGCRLNPGAGKKLTCGGAPIDVETLIRASACATFGAIVVMQVRLPAFVRPAPLAAPEDDD